MDQQQTGSRLLEACNTCRKRKVKCDRQRPSCATCLKSRTACSYTDRVKVLKTPRRKPTKAKLFEERLGRVESLLSFPVELLDKVAKEIVTRENGPNHLARSVSNETENQIMSSESPQHDDVVMDDSTHMTTEIPAKENEYLVDSVTASSTSGTSNSRDSSSPGRTFKPLPPKYETVFLLSMYFLTINNVFPVLDKKSFMKLVDERYSTGPHEDPAWWASLNVALAHSFRSRALFSPAQSEDEQSAWGFLENALAVVPSLAVTTPSLSSIEALLGMAAFLQGTPIPRSYSLLVATAIRLGHSIGLHRQEAYSTSMPSAQIEHRRRVFWLGYIMDKDISMRSGQPSIQHDDDIDVEFPDESTSGGVGYVKLSQGLPPVNFLQLRINLAVIQGAISKELYSARALKQPASSRDAIIQQLDERLERWKDSTTFDFQPAYLTKMVEGPVTLHIVILYFTYFNCLTLVHRCTFQNMPWKTRSPDSIEPFNPRNFSTNTKVIEAARTAINLLSLVPQKNLAFLWLILQFSCSATITLLRNIQLNPALPTAPSDYKLVAPMLGIFCKLARLHVSKCTEHASGDLKDNDGWKKSGITIELVRMRDFCFVLRDRAKAVLDVVWAGNENYLHADREIQSYGLMDDSMDAAQEDIDIPMGYEIVEDHYQAQTSAIRDFGSTSQQLPTMPAFPPQSGLTAIDSQVIVPDAMVQQQPTATFDYTEPTKPVSPNIFEDVKISDGFINDGDSSSNIIVPNSVVKQDDRGMWNWWDLIDMDSEGNRGVE